MGVSRLNYAKCVVPLDESFFLQSPNLGLCVSWSLAARYVADLAFHPA